MRGMRAGCDLQRVWSGVRNAAWHRGKQWHLAWKGTEARKGTRVWRAQGRVTFRNMEWRWEHAVAAVVRGPALLLQHPPCRLASAKELLDADACSRRLMRSMLELPPPSEPRRWS